MTGQNDAMDLGAAELNVSDAFLGSSKVCLDFMLRTLPSMMPAPRLKDTYHETTLHWYSLFL